MQGLRLLYLGLLLQPRVRPQQLRADVFLHELDTEEYDLLEEVDNESFSHLASEGHCLLLRLLGVQGDALALPAPAVRRSLIQLLLLAAMVGLLPPFALVQGSHEALDDLAHVVVHGLLSTEAVYQLEHDARGGVRIEHLSGRLGHHCVDDLHADVNGGSLVVGDDPEELEVEDVEVSCPTRDRDLLQQGFTENGDGDSLDLVEERDELAHELLPDLDVLVVLDQEEGQRLVDDWRELVPVR